MGIYHDDGAPICVARQFFMFNGSLWGYLDCGDACRGTYERTGPATWTDRNPMAPGHIDIFDWCVWKNRLWVHTMNDDIQSTPDGIAWSVEWTPPANHHISAVNGYGNHLYVAYGELVGWIVPTMRFACYDGSVWNTDCVAPYAHAGGLGSHDIIGYGGHVYWSMVEADTGNNYLKRWTGSAWQNDPDAASCGEGYFTVHEGVLYMASHSLDEIWRKAGTTKWKQDFAPGLHALRCELSIGDDNLLYISFELDLHNIRPYRRAKGVWRRCFADLAEDFGGSVSFYDGDGYVGGLGQVWRYAPSFAVSPVGGGLYPQATDVDGDGNALYVGLYDAAGRPLLIRAELPLTPDGMGTLVFGPAVGGTAINVKCGLVGEQVAVAGRFSAGGLDSVQASEDGGGTWQNVAGGWGDTAQPILVGDTLDNMLACLDANQDIYVTDDQGASWTQTQAAIGYSPDAAAWLPQQRQEVVLGDADVAVKVSYSPNKGETLADISGGLADDVVAIEVV